MSDTLHVHFRGLPASAAIEERIEHHYQHLNQRFQRQAITSCHVYLELLTHRPGKDGCFRVVIEVQVPGKTLAVGQEPGWQPNHQDPYLEISEAFAAMDRQLHAHAQRIRQDVKHHQPQAEGEVVRLFSHEGFGFIESKAGDEYYFNENAVLSPGFERLETGARVRFAPEAGRDGPQASTVHIMETQPRR